MTHRIYRIRCLQRFMVAAAALSALAALGGAPLSVLAQSMSHESRSLAATYDFQYRASDNRVNVFDDGALTRIQLPEGTLLPTILALQPKGEVVLHPRRDGPFLAVEGVHMQLRLRWANARDVAVAYTGQKLLPERAGQGAAFGAVAATSSYGSAAKPVAARVSAPVAPSASAERTAALDALNYGAPSAPTAQVSAPAAAPAPAPVAGTASEAQAGAPATGAVRAASVSFEVTPSDKTVREVLMRWAQAVQWSFGPEHWTVAVDLPVVASARLGSDFKGAVRELLESTTLGDVPLQPCFYANQVLRVVPRTERCDRLQ